MRKFNPYRGDAGKFQPRDGAAVWDTRHYRALDRAIADKDTEALGRLRAHAERVPSMRKPGGRGKQNVIVQIDRALGKAASTGGMGGISSVGGGSARMTMTPPTDMSRKRRMKAFKIDEISMVDKPAQAGAVATMMKRDDSVDRFIEGILVSPDLANAIAKVDSSEADKGKIYLKALDTSLRSILGDTNLRDEDRLVMLRKSASDFLQVAKDELPGIEGYIRKSLGSRSDEMNLGQLKKKMDQLNTKFDRVLKRREQDDDEFEKGDDDEFEKGEDEGDEDGVLFKAKKPSQDSGGENGDDVAARLAQLFGRKHAAKGPTITISEDDSSDTGDGTDVRQEVTEDNQDQLDEGDDMGKAYGSDTGGTGYEMGSAGTKGKRKKPKTTVREGFITTQGEEEDKIAAGSTTPIGGHGHDRMGKRTRLRDEILEIGDRTIAKSDVGDDLFEVLKAQAEETERVAKALDDERDLRELVEFAKVAEDQLSHLPGSVEEKARLLKNLSEYLDDDERKLLTKMLVSGDRSAGTAFRTFGHKIDKGLGSPASFQKRVAAIKSRDGCSNIEAMQKARREDPEAYDAYQAGQA